MSGALVFMSGALMLVAVTEGMPLDCLAVVASGACVPKPHRTATIRESSQQPATPKALKGSRHIPTLPVEYLLVLELQPEGYLEVHISRGLQRCSQGT